MTDNFIYEIYKKGSENKYYITNGASRTFKRQLFSIGFYIVSLFVSPRKEIPPVFSYVNGNKKKYADIEIGNLSNVYRGYMGNGFKEWRESLTFWSPFTRKERMFILIKTINLYLEKKLHGDFAGWFEFNIIYTFCKKSSIKKLITRGHYDDINMWLGELSKIYNFEIEMYQHGIVLSEIKIPHKIHYSTVYVFDEYSRNVFTKNYVSNANCIYKIYDYKPSCKFEFIKNFNKSCIYIGIGEQCNPKWTQEMINIIEKTYHDINYKVFVMLHPNSQYEYNAKNVEVCRIKYYNIDILLTEFSTLPLDYYRSKSDARVIFTLQTDCYCNYPFVLCNTEEMIVKELEKIKNEKFVYSRK